MESIINPNDKVQMTNEEIQCQMSKRKERR